MTLHVCVHADAQNQSVNSQRPLLCGQDQTSFAPQKLSAFHRWDPDNFLHPRFEATEEMFNFNLSPTPESHKSQKNTFPGGGGRSRFPNETSSNQCHRQVSGGLG